MPGRQLDEAVFFGVVAEERRVEVVGNHAGSRLLRRGVAREQRVLRELLERAALGTVGSSCRARMPAPGSGQQERAGPGGDASPARRRAVAEQLRNGSLQALDRDGLQRRQCARRMPSGPGRCWAALPVPGG